MEYSTHSLEAYIKPPLLEFFKLEGLNGYKTIEIHFEKNIKIVAAENGAGKTTLMNALYATLTGKISILSSIDFQSIRMKFIDSNEYVIEKSEIFNNLNDQKAARKFMMNSRSFRRLVDFGDVSPEQILELVQKKITGEEYTHTSIYRRIYNNSPLDHDDIEEFLNSTTEEIGFSLNPKLKDIFESIKNSLSNVSVLYLPTYRRIETETDKEDSNQKTFINSRHSFRARSEWDSDKLMYFGLSDVENKLKSKASNIRQKALQAYSEASGETLQRLIFKTSDNPNFEQSDLEKITVVLNRIGKENIKNDEISQEISKYFENGSINNEDKKELRSFLKQLLNIYDNTAKEEKAIEVFVDAINSYWDEDSEKKFSFNKQDAEAEVYNLYTKKKLLLNMLSSGEKQIISILARMILEPTKKYLVLIDEPELSLSIEWQKRFLLDIVKGQSCHQLIAITHSPFIFDNDLKSFAGSFEISYTKEKGQE